MRYFNIKSIFVLFSYMSNIDKYRIFVSEQIDKDIDSNPLFDIPQIKDCTRYVLADGKRLRSMIVLSICNCLNVMTGQNLNAIGGALAIEYIHNASLIIDDMPMMDNDILRRDKATAHIKWGLCTSQLTAYNLIIAAMRHLADNLDSLSRVPFLTYEQFRQISRFLYHEFTQRLSVDGLCGGQYLDLHVKENFNELSPKAEKQNNILDLIRRKTSSLFELSFILGWLFGGGILEETDAIRKIGRSFGILFQIIDDLADFKQDISKGNNNNICQYYDKSELHSLFMTNLESYRTGLLQLQLFTPLFKDLYNYMVKSYRSFALD